MVLVGVSGSGKSTWAARHFAPAQVVSSDALRGVVGLHERDQRASKDAFAVLDQIVDARLRRGLTTVIDTTGLEPERRAAWLAMARRRDRPAHVVVLDVPEREARARNKARDDPVPSKIVTAQLRNARRRRATPSRRGLRRRAPPRPATSPSRSSRPASSPRSAAPEPNRRLPCPFASPSTSAASSSRARARSWPTTCERLGPPGRGGRLPRHLGDGPRGADPQRRSRVGGHAREHHRARLPRRRHRAPAASAPSSTA